MSLVYKVVSIDPKTGEAYSDFGGFRTVFPIFSNDKLLESKKGFHTAKTKEHAVDYYSGLTDNEDVVLTLIPLKVSETSGDEVILLKAKIIDIKYL